MIGSFLITSFVYLLTGAPQMNIINLFLLCFIMVFASDRLQEDPNESEYKQDTDLTTSESFNSTIQQQNSTQTATNQTLHESNTTNTESQDRPETTASNETQVAVNQSSNETVSNTTLVMNSNETATEVGNTNETQVAETQTPSETERPMNETRAENETQLAVEKSSNETKVVETPADVQPTAGDDINETAAEKTIAESTDNDPVESTVVEEIEFPKHIRQHPIITSSSPSASGFQFLFMMFFVAIGFVGWKNRQRLSSTRRGKPGPPSTASRYTPVTRTEPTDDWEDWGGEKASITSSSENIRSRHQISSSPMNESAKSPKGNDFFSDLGMVPQVEKSRSNLNPFAMEEEDFGLDDDQDGWGNELDDL